MGQTDIKDTYFADGHGETVDNGEGLVLVLATVDEYGQNEVAPVVVLLKVFYVFSLHELQADEGATHFCHGLLVGLGIVEKGSVNQTLAIAYKP